MLFINLDFTINLGSLFAYLGGIASGIVLFILIYFLYVMVYLKKQEVRISSLSQEIDQKQIEVEIKIAQMKFLEQKKELGEINVEVLKEVSLELMNSIAKLYYPESKRPLGELTIKEILLLDQYLVDKIDDILNKFGIKFSKKVKLNTIINILNMKKNIDNNNVVKATKKFGKFTSNLLVVLNFINPVMWFKKGIITPTTNLIIKKICLLVIATVGYETYHVYSKQAFLDPVLDNELEKLISIIESPSFEEEQEQKKKDKIVL